MEVDDLDLDRAPRTRVRSVRVAVGVLIAVGVLVVAIMIQQRVETSAALHKGPWEFDVDFLPAWLPPGFSGELAALRNLPHEVPLRAATWNEDLASAIEKNPWIRRVEKLEKVGASVHFEAIFERPVIAVRGDGQFLLLDSSSTVIDVQPGEELSIEWGIAYYAPRRPAPAARAGERLTHPEFVELQSLVEVLWRDGIFDTYADKIPELTAKPVADGSLIWSILLSNGAELRWGRAPGSERVSPLSNREKLSNLRAVLDDWSNIGTTRLIVLSEETRPIRR